MNSLNSKYIARELNEVIKELNSSGKKRIVNKLEPKKDKDILDTQVIIKVEEKQDSIIITTSMFKKYI